MLLLFGCSDELEVLFKPGKALVDTDLYAVTEISLGG